MNAYLNLRVAFTQRVEVGFIVKLLWSWKLCQRIVLPNRNTGNTFPKYWKQTRLHQSSFSPQLRYLFSGCLSKQSVYPTLVLLFSPHLMTVSPHCTELFECKITYGQGLLWHHSLPWLKKKRSCIYRGPVTSWPILDPFNQDSTNP